MCVGVFLDYFNTFCWLQIYSGEWSTLAGRAARAGTSQGDHTGRPHRATTRVAPTMDEGAWAVVLAWDCLADVLGGLFAEGL